MMLITFGIHLLRTMHKKCTTYLSDIFSKLCSNKQKNHYGFKAYPCPNILIPLAKWTMYASILKSNSFFFFNLMPKRWQNYFANPHSISKNKEGQLPPALSPMKWY